MYICVDLCQFVFIDSEVNDTYISYISYIYLQEGGDLRKLGGRILNFILSHVFCHIYFKKKHKLKNKVKKFSYRQKPVLS